MTSSGAAQLGVGRALAAAVVRSARPHGGVRALAHDEATAARALPPRPRRRPPAARVPGKENKEGSGPADLRDKGCRVIFFSTNTPIEHLISYYTVYVWHLIDNLAVSAYQQVEHVFNLQPNTGQQGSEPSC